MISSPAVMKRVVQAAPGPACTRQCPGVCLSSTCSQFTRVLCAPAPSLHPLLALARTSASRPCPDWLSLPAPVTLTQVADFQPDQISWEKGFRDTVPYLIQRHFIYLNIHILYLLFQCPTQRTSDDVN